jgi:hypothetical protein
MFVYNTTVVMSKCYDTSVISFLLNAGCPAPSDKKLGQILGQFLRNFRAKI